MSLACSPPLTLLKLLCCVNQSILVTAVVIRAAVASQLQARFRACPACVQIYSVSCHSNAAQLHCQVAVPGASVLLTPLYAKKVCQVPLSQSLQDGQQQATVKASQNGLLSMDQARSLLPLLADDPNVGAVPRNYSSTACHTGTTSSRTLKISNLFLLCRSSNTLHCGVIPTEHYIYIFLQDEFVPVRYISFIKEQHTHVQETASCSILV